MKPAGAIVIAVMAMAPVLVCDAAEIEEGNNAVDAKHVKVYYEKGRFGG